LTQPSGPHPPAKKRLCRLAPMPGHNL